MTLCVPPELPIEVQPGARGGLRGPGRGPEPDPGPGPGRGRPLPGAGRRPDRAAGSHGQRGQRALRPRAPRRHALGLPGATRSSRRFARWRERASPSRRGPSRPSPPPGWPRSNAGTQRPVRLDWPGLGYLVLGLVAGLAAVERKGFLQAMLSRPIVLAPLIGWALGEPAVGLHAGAAPRAPLARGGQPRRGRAGPRGAGDVGHRRRSGAGRAGRGRRRHPGDRHPGGAASAPGGADRALGERGPRPVVQRARSPAGPRPSSPCTTCGRPPAATCTAWSSPSW